MHKHAETFHVNKGCKLAIAFFKPISLLSKQKFRVQFSNVIYTKTRPCTFLYENESLGHCLSYDLKRMETLLVLEVRFSKGSAFSQVQGPQSGSGSGFQNDAHRLFFLCLFRKADQISELKELNRSKVISHFLEQPIYKRKSEYDFGNSIGDKNTRSSEMKSKFRFSKAKKKGKSTKFRGKLISLPHKNSWKVWGKLKSGMRILWNL